MTKSTPVRIHLSHIPSPVGTLHVASIDDVAYYIAFDTRNHESEMESYFRRSFGSYELLAGNSAAKKILYELEHYFEGTLRRFTVKTHLFGTDFQLQVLTALRTVPFGRTTTYKTVAEMIGNPAATRAVGGAVGSNPIPIIVPCHRVIGENGKLVGFGGGIERKKKLLRLEGSLLV